MNYNDWIEALENIKKTRRNNSILEKLEKEKINENIEKHLSDRINETVILKLKEAIKRVQNEIKMVFNDENSLEMIMNNFKKDMLYIKRICLLKQYNEERRAYMLNQIYIISEDTFDMLADESLKIDGTGMYKQIINKKRIKKDDLK